MGGSNTQKVADTIAQATPQQFAQWKYPVEAQNLGLLGASEATWTPSHLMPAL
jgi:hypothetical protein